MISYEIVKECLDILELKYADFHDEGFCVSFSDSEHFPYPIDCYLFIYEDNTLQFTCYARDFLPQGDLLSLANRHNCRSHMPSCHISDEGKVVMERFYFIPEDVSPNYILNDVIRSTISACVTSFTLFEKDDEEYDALIN